MDVIATGIELHISNSVAFERRSIKPISTLYKSIDLDFYREYIRANGRIGVNIEARARAPGTLQEHTIQHGYGYGGLAVTHSR